MLVHGPKLAIEKMTGLGCVRAQGGLVLGETSYISIETVTSSSYLWTVLGLTIPGSTITETTMYGTELEKVSSSKAFGGDLVKYKFKVS